MRSSGGPGASGDDAAARNVPLGPDFRRAQLAQFVSLLADHSVMWIVLWWLLVTRKNATADEAVQLVAPSLLLPLLSLPVAGTLADFWDRARIIRLACLLRAACHVAVAGMLYTGTLTVERGVWVLVLSGLAGAFFDASFTPMLPALVPASQAERALDYSLALPRAGYFIASFILLLLLAMLGERIVSVLGIVFLLVASVAIAGIEASTQPAVDPQGPTRPASAQAWLRAFFDGPLVLLRSPRLLFVTLLSMLANFVMAPLFWLGPASLTPGARLPKTLPENSEVVLVLGVVAGALATPHLCRRFPAEKVAAVSLLGLALGLSVLGPLRGADALYATLVVLGFALVQVTGLAGGTATLACPDPKRARIGALVWVAFELGGELGSHTLRPLIIQQGLSTVLWGLAGLLFAIALPWSLIPTARLPAWLRL